MALAVEDILNSALSRIGYQTPIGYIFEGSRAARVAVQFYSQERDDVLSSNDWQFARQQVALTVLKTAPVGGYNISTPWTTAYPLQPWIYEYAYPNGCLKVRSIRRSMNAVPNYDPVPNTFTDANDPALTTAAKVILTNVPNAIASFTGRVIDPAQWLDPSFVEALIDRMALRFQENLNPQPDAVKMRAAEAQGGEAAGQDSRG